jgi:hypothetical protein
LGWRREKRRQASGATNSRLALVGRKRYNPDICGDDAVDDVWTDGGIAALQASPWSPV